MRVRHLVSATIAKQDEDRTQRFLSAASRGDAATVRAVGPLPSVALQQP